VWLGLADGRVFESDDDGVSWSLVGTVPRPPTTIVVDGANDDVWVGTEGLGLFRLKPEPVIHTGAVPVDVLSVGATPYVTDTVALLLGRVLPDRHNETGALLPAIYAVFESADGDTWSRRVMTEGLGTDLLVPPDFSDTRRLYSGSLLSDDAGLTWRSVAHAPSGALPHVVAVGPITGTQPVLYGLADPYEDGTGGSGLHQSLDGAQSWTRCDTVQQGIVSVVVSPDYENDRSVFFATDKGFIHRATDGLTFSSIGRIPSIGPLEQVIFDMAISPAFARDRTLYVAADDPADLMQQAKVFASTTSGQSWQARNTGLHRASHPRTMALSPSFETDRLVFLGGLRGKDDPEAPTLYASDSAGAEWFMEAFLPPSEIRGFAFVGEVATGRLFAAASAAGLWVRDLTVPVGPGLSTPTNTSVVPSATFTVEPGSATPTPTGGSPGPTWTPDMTTSPTAPPTVSATVTLTVTATTPAGPTAPATTRTPTGSGTPESTTTVTATPDASRTVTATDEPAIDPVYLPFSTRH
jgi:hypothetical protein